MDLPFFVRGLVLGFSIAAVLGPIGVLCLRRTLASGFLTGFVSGLGAATADASYAAIAGFGVSALASLLLDQREALRLIGGAFLVYLGVRSLLSARNAPPATATSSNGVGGTQHLIAAYTSTLSLTLSNPMTILSFGAIFAGLGLGSLGATSTATAVELVVGVFVGSAAWWLVLASFAARLRTRVTPPRLRLVNLLSGLLILAFGVQSLASAVRPA